MLFPSTDKRCPNSTSGKHKLLDRIGKNKDKPNQCVYCHRHLPEPPNNTGEK